jgi:hypothetical protein
MTCFLAVGGLKGEASLNISNKGSIIGCFSFPEKNQRGDSARLAIITFLTSLEETIERSVFFIFEKKERQITLS